MAELELMERRVGDIEKYLGIQEIEEVGGEITAYEALEKKAKRLDDFIKFVEDKHYIMGDLYGKYEQMEGYLKGTPNKDSQSSLVSPEMELRLSQLPLHHKRANLVLECQDDLLNFVDDLEDLQKLEQYLNFDPLVDVPDKLSKLRKLKVAHTSHLLEA